MFAMFCTSEKYNDASDAEDSEGEVKRRGSGSEYDSDRDPVWTPLEEVG